MTTQKRLRFSLPVTGPFSMQSARTLQCGCMRASRVCTTSGAVKLAFPLDDTFDIVGVKLEHKDDAIEVDAVGTDDQATLARQLSRILAIDHDGNAFARVLKSDPALRALDEQAPGFRPIVFFSPYVSAGWHVLSHRISMAQAAVVQARLAEESGDVVEIDGERLPAFPPPQTFLRMSGFKGIAEEKWVRLRGIAEAALEGKLAIDRLVKMRPEDALKDLMQLRGVGKFIAEAILIRGCGPTDMLPSDHAMLKRGVAKVYGLEQEPSDGELEGIAEGWKPFRTWVTVMLVREGFVGGPAGRERFPRRRA